MATKNTEALSILDKLKQNNDDSLHLFLSRMAKFDRIFCDLMAEGNDFTIKLEVRGGRGRISYCKVHFDEIAYSSKGNKSNAANDLGD